MGKTSHNVFLLTDRKKDNSYCLAGYEIRSTRLEDREGIGRVHLESWKTSYKGIIEQSFLESLSLQERLKQREKLLLESSDIQLVITFLEEIIGFCVANDLRFHSYQQLSEEQRLNRSEKGELYTIHVIKKHQGKGLGKALFQEAGAQLKQRNLVPFLVWVLKGNTKARQFYESQGGILVDEVSVKMGDEYYQEVAYRFK